MRDRSRFQEGVLSSSGEVRSDVRSDSGSVARYLRARSASGAVVAALSVLTAPAGAQGTTFAQVTAAGAAGPGGVPVTADARARELYLRGDRLYAEGNYDDALAAFHSAYDLSHRPELLYNMANALERLGRYEEAKAYLVELVPLAAVEQRPVLTRRIESLQSRIDRQQADVAAPPSSGALPAASTGADSLGAGSSGAGSFGAGPSAAESVSPPITRALDTGRVESRPSAPLLGYVLAGAGLASVGASVLFALSAGQARDDARRQCADPAAGRLCPAAAEQDIAAQRSRAITADVLMGVGVLAVASGGFLLWRSWTPEQAMALRMRVGLGEGDMSLVANF